MTKEKIKFYQNQSYGTENYYRHSLNQKFLYTDGVRTMAKELSAYWLIDIMATQTPVYAKKTNDTFGICKLIKNTDDSAIFTIDDGNGNIKIQQDIEFTDIKENVQAYIQLNEEFTWIACMPSEY